MDHTQRREPDGERKNDCRGMRLRKTTLAEEGLFCQVKEFEFYPEGHSGP